MTQACRLPPEASGRPHVVGEALLSSAMLWTIVRPPLRCGCEHHGQNKMQLVTAIIKPFKLEEVREALSALGVQGMTVSDVKGFGRQRGHTEIYRGAEYAVLFVPKVKIEIVLGAIEIERVIEAIRRAAGMGRIGDGKIFVSPIEHAVRIRTGETDDAAL
jgi:nitrogen regulatory protein P-II 2